MAFADEQVRRPVLLVEDDAAVLNLVDRELNEDGYEVDTASHGTRGLEMALECRYDLLILDIELPGCSGIDILRQVRTVQPTTPVLMLTVRHQEREIVAGLDAGADDYLAKPFSMAELKARVRALLRRRAALPEDSLEWRGLTLDRTAGVAFTDATAVDLTRKEFLLLEALVRRPERLVTRSRLLAEVWGMRFDPGTNSIDVHLFNLRRKLAGVLPHLEIRTVRGAGLMLTEVSAGQTDGGYPDTEVASPARQRAAR